MRWLWGSNRLKSTSTADIVIPRTAPFFCWQLLIRCNAWWKTSPRCRHLAILIKHHCLTTVAAIWRNGRNIRVVFDSGLFPASYENMTSSTKLEIRSISHCLHRRTEPRTQITSTGNLAEFGLRFLRYASGQTDKQTDIQTRWSQHLAPVSGAT